MYKIYIKEKKEIDVFPRSLGNSSFKYLKDPEEASHRVVIGADQRNPNGTITMLLTVIE